MSAGWLLRAFGILVLAVNAPTSQMPGRVSLPPTTAPQVKTLHITILSTMLADEGIGEWGFSALIDADGHRILFDTGNRPETVLANARELGIDLSTVTDVVLSHHHGDHTGGLLTLRRALAKVNPAALSRVHVAPGILLSRRGAPDVVRRIERVPLGSDQEANPFIAMKPAIEATGAVIVEHTKPTELVPGVWLTGPIPRRYAERNWSPGISIVTADGLVADSVPEDMALIINTEQGLVVVTGCGHAGIVNILAYAREFIAPRPAYAVVGGLHLFRATDETLAWTADRLHAIGLAYLLGAHCTGIEAVFRIRQLAGLDRRSAVVAAVGSSFDLARGIDPLALAQ